MSRRAKERECGQAEAHSRLDQAIAFLGVAILGHAAEDGPDRSVSTSNAVLAPIAAADTITCATLRRHSVSPSHPDAVALVGQVPHIGGEVASHLARLLAMKTKAQYEARHPTRAEASQAVRLAGRLVALARESLGG